MADKRDDDPREAAAPAPTADPDRAAILARRQHFMALALSGLATAACTDGKGRADTSPHPCLKVEVRDEDEDDEAPPHPCLSIVAPDPKPDPCLKVAAPETETGADTGETGETETGAEDTGAEPDTKPDTRPRPCLRKAPPRVCLKTQPPALEPEPEPEPKPSPCLRKAKP